MSAPIPMPPLPEAWPYIRRAEGPCLERISAQVGDGEWTLVTRGRLDLSGFPEPMSGVFGRGGIRRLGDVVMRPYRRGGLVRLLNERIYASPRRFEREFTVHQALWDAGFPTVEPLGYGYRRRFWGVEGVFLTRFAEATPWPACWERNLDMVVAVRRILDSLTLWGLHAPDLNATNILLTSTGGVLALDWDRAAWVSDQNLGRRYRERLQRSLLKLEAPAGVLHAFQDEWAG